MSSDLILGMAGAGGDGIVSAGESLMTALAAEGYHALMTKSFGPQIRGGESSCRLRIATRPVSNPGGTLDVAVALNWDDFLKFGAELPVGGRTLVIYDSATRVDPGRLPLPGVTPAEALAVPIGELARGQGGSDKAKNTVVLGLLAGWLGLPSARMLAGLRRKLGKKGESVLQNAERAYAAGLKWARAHALRCPMSIDAPSGGAKLLADGNEMCAAAAIFAGCRFFGGYPITPSSEIMHLLGREIWKHGGTMLQAEDEIAGIGAAVGASFAGVKAMTATSGPGMSLKAEMLGLASIAELPLVCVNVQRGGPSTGIPTKAEQADLFQAVFSAHGDVARPVLAPTGVADTFELTVEAFNLAERYQTPVILLSDQDVAQRKETVDAPDTAGLRVESRRVPEGTELDDYQRFRVTDSGVSPISHPGLPGGNYLASGIEHNERGAPTARGDVHARMNEKRFRKLLPLQQRRDLIELEGDPGAPLCLIAWGSLAGVAREARRAAEADGLRCKLIVPRLLYPLPEGVWRDLLASVRCGLVVEQSHQGQFHRLLRMHVELPPGLMSLARSGANPFTPAEVHERVRQLALGLQRHGAPEPEPALG